MVGSVYLCWPRVPCCTRPWGGRHSKPFGGSHPEQQQLLPQRWLVQRQMPDWHMPVRMINPRGRLNVCPTTSFSEDKNTPRGTMASFRNPWKQTLNQIRGLKAEICYQWVNLAGVTGHITAARCCCYCTPQIRLWGTPAALLTVPLPFMQPLKPEKSLTPFRCLSCLLVYILHSPHPAARPFPPDLSLLANAVGTAQSSAFPRKGY